MSRSQLGLVVILIVAAVAAFLSLNGDPAATGDPSTGTHPSRTEGGIDDSEPVIDPTGRVGTSPAEQGAKRVEAKAQTPREEEAAVLTGLVTDSRGPIANAKISWYNGTKLEQRIGGLGELADVDFSQIMEQLKSSAKRDAIEARTGDDGRFRLLLPKSQLPLRKPIKLEISAKGYLSTSPKVTPRPGDKTDIGTVTLERGIVLSGVVQNANGLPIKGAHLSQVSADIPFAFGALFDLGNLGKREATDADGRFELTLRKPGEIRLRAKHADYAYAEWNGKAKRGDTIDHIVIRFAPPARISGRVTGLPDGTEVSVAAQRVREKKDDTPLAGMFESVMAQAVPVLGGGGERKSKVDAQGVFQLKGLAQDKRYKVWAQTKRGKYRTVRCSEIATVSAGERGLRIVYAPGVRVTLRVVDQASGEPLTSYTVRAGLTKKIEFGPFSTPTTNPIKQQVKPDKDGRVELLDLRPTGDHGKLTIELKATGYRKLTKRDLRVPAKGSIDLGVFRLEPAKIVRVHVSDRAPGEPIAKARVKLVSGKSPRLARNVTPPAAGLSSLFSGERSSARTDKDGWCELTALRVSPYRIEVRSPKHARHHSDALQLAPGGKNEHRFTLSKGATIEVAVVDPRSKAIADTRVSHKREDGSTDSETTDASGVAHFNHLVPGEHRFRLDKPSDEDFLNISIDFASSSSKKDKPEAPWTTVTVADLATATLTLTQPLRGALHGTITVNAAPLAGARVALRPRDEPVSGSGQAESILLGSLGSLGDFAGLGGKKGKTDPRGRYRIDNWPTGEYRLRISHKDLSTPATAMVVVTEGESRHDVALLTASITGRVTDAEGEPIARARIQVLAAGKGADNRTALALTAMSEMGEMFGLKQQGIKTRANGTYRVDGISAGRTLVLRATSSSHVPANSAEIRLVEGQTKSGVDFKLEEGGAIRISVAEPVQMAAVQATLKGDTKNVPRFAMLKKGRAVLKGLEPGVWLLELRSQRDKGMGTKTVTVEAGKTQRVDW
ncbi:MAG: hypothetical protein CMJ85_08220 [Planctomycetes bacterium]|nr:hypothetical protein [Planctomycetota bacterium]